VGPGRRRHRIRVEAAATDSSLNDGPFALHYSSSRAWRASFRDSQLPHLKERAMSQRTLMMGGFVLSMDSYIGDLPAGDVLIEDGCPRGCRRRRCSNDSR
jgi:hypothetical protein